MQNQYTIVLFTEGKWTERIVCHIWYICHLWGKSDINEYTFLKKTSLFYDYPKQEFKSRF